MNTARICVPGARHSSVDETPVRVGRGQPPSGETPPPEDRHTEEHGGCEHDHRLGETGNDPLGAGRRHVVWEFGLVAFGRRRLWSGGVWNPVAQVPDRDTGDGDGLNDRHPEPCFERGDIDIDAVRLRLVHHVQRDHRRNSHVEQLQRQEEVTIELRGIDDVDHRVSREDDFAGDPFFLVERRDPVDTRCVDCLCK